MRNINSLSITRAIRVKYRRP